MKTQHSTGDIITTMDGRKFELVKETMRDQWIGKGENGILMHLQLFGGVWSVLGAA